MGQLEGDEILKFFIEKLDELDKSIKKVLSECKKEYERFKAFEAGKAHYVFLYKKDILNRIANLQDLNTKYDGLRNKMSSMIANLELYYKEEIKKTMSVEKHGREKVA